MRALGITNKRERERERPAALSGRLAFCFTIQIWERPNAARSSQICVHKRQQEKQTCYEAGCESGRRIGRRARSSTEETPRRTARSTGFRLAANCATPASQVFWAIYSVAMQ